MLQNDKDKMKIVQTLNVAHTMSALRIRTQIAESLGTSFHNWPQFSQIQRARASKTYFCHGSETVVKAPSKNKTSQSSGFLTALNRMILLIKAVVRRISTIGNPSGTIWICLWATQGHPCFQWIWQAWWIRSWSSRTIVGFAIAAYVTVALCSLVQVLGQ